MAILFDAVGDVLFRDTALPSPTGSWTFMYWVQFNGLAAGVYADALWLHTPTGGSTSYVFLGGRGLSDIVYEPTGGAVTAVAGVVEPNTWYHIAASSNAGAAPLVYLDGVHVATAGSAIGAFTPARLRIGNNPTAARSLLGRLAHLRIYEAVLTPSEIQIERLAPLHQRTANLNSSYPFTDTATAITDISGNNRTLTVGGTLTTADGPPLGFEQYAFRARNDDGSEATATPKAAENAAFDIVPDETFRIRTGVNSFGLNPPKRVKQQYRKVGDASYRDIDTQG